MKVMNYINEMSGKIIDQTEATKNYETIRCCDITENFFSL